MLEPYRKSSIRIYLFFFFFRSLFVFALFYPYLCLCILLGPLFRRRNGSGFVVFPALRNVGSERIIGVGSAEKGLDGKQDRPNLQRRRPVICDDV